MHLTSNKERQQLENKSKEVIEIIVIVTQQINLKIQNERTSDDKETSIDTRQIKTSHRQTKN